MTRFPTSVLLPASLAADNPSLRQKTVKVGSVGRSLAIFRVGKVCIYNDDDPRVKNQKEEYKLISLLLSYMDTPQYLRKLLFPSTNELSYAGLLPPLRTPHHPLESEKDREGDYRDGVVLETNGRRSLLEIGLHEKGVVEEKLAVSQRLTVKLGKRSGNLIQVAAAAREDVREYWGYEVTHAKSLTEGLKVLKSDYSIGTSRRGQNLYEAVEAIKSGNPRSVAVAFGGPYAGLPEICERQGADVGELFDILVNTVPEQGTATVRTEEALLVTLALLNAMGGE
jgi:hypothetical protein